jgi:hypothetical protein
VPTAVQATAIQYLQDLGSPELLRGTNTSACYTNWTTLALNDTATPPVITSL